MEGKRWFKTEKGNGDKKMEQNRKGSHLSCGTIKLDDKLQYQLSLVTVSFIPYQLIISVSFLPYQLISPVYRGLDLKDPKVGDLLIHRNLI